MDHLRQLGNRISIPISADENAFTGRECPQLDCEGYFKIEFGTGLKGEGLPCHCPYCGHTAGHDHFWTKEQIEYAKSVAMRKITDALQKDLKTLEFDHKLKGITFSEAHNELECENRHSKSDFTNSPICSDCHDDKSFPKDLPGKRGKK